MYSYNDFPDTAKVWVYQSNRLLTDDEVNKIKSSASEFLTNWESHGSKVKGYIEVRYNAFVIVMADDSGDRMCGRAIDGSVRFMKELEKELQLPFLDRMNTAWVEQGKLVVGNMNVFREKVSRNEINTQTVVYNNTITTKSEFETNWKVEIKHSWHKQII